MLVSRNLVLVLATLVLSGCSAELQKAMQEGLRSGTSLETLAASGTFTAKTEQVTVMRSKAQVMAGLESFSKQCLNVSVKYGRFSGDGAIQNDYIPKFTNEDGFTRHVLFRKAGGHSVIQVSEAGRGLNAAASTKIQPVNDDTTLLTITTLRGLSGYSKAITNAASGHDILCPTLP